MRFHVCCIAMKWEFREAGNIIDDFSTGLSAPIIEKSSGVTGHSWSEVKFFCMLPNGVLFMMFAAWYTILLRSNAVTSQLVKFIVPSSLFAACTRISAAPFLAWHPTGTTVYLIPLWKYSFPSSSVTNSLSRRA